MTNRQREVRKLEEQLSKLIETSNGKTLKKTSIAKLRIPGITLRDYKTKLIEMINTINQSTVDTNDEEEEAVQND